MRCETVEQLLKDSRALLASGGRIGGARDVQGALVKGADQYVGQWGNRLRSDSAGIHCRLEPVLKQAEAIAVGKIPPGLPAEHSRPIE